MAIRGLILESSDTAYTQVYIANFDLITGSPAKPAIAPGCFLPGTEEVPVFDINPSTGGGTVRPEPEPTSGTEPIWIVSVNERRGNFISSTASSTTTPPITCGKRELRLVAATVEELHEPWIGGQCEIMFAMTQTPSVSCPNGPDEEQYYATAYWDHSERYRSLTRGYIRKLHRNMVGEEWNYPNDQISPWLASNLSSNPIGPKAFVEGSTMFFIMYESDNPVSPLRVVDSPSTGRSLTYHSFDDGLFFNKDLVYDNLTNASLNAWVNIELYQGYSHIGLKYRNF